MVSFSETNFNRLQKAIDWSQDQLETPRRKRVEAIQQLVGFHYSDDGAPRTVPINLLKLAIEIYVRSLAPKAPRALISHKFLKPTAANLELAVNQIPAEIELSATFRRLVTEALFSIGVAKIGLHRIGQILGHDYGEPFVDVITMDDYFVDMSAKRREQIQFEGNDYWLTYEEVQESNWFDKKAKAKISGDDEEATIGERGEQRGEGVSTGGSTVESYKRRVWLRDVWLPLDGLFVTYSVRNKKQLKTTEWDKPERGPYRVLGYADVPSNILPLPPVAVWRDLHELANALYRKLGRQADGQKSVLGFDQADDEGIKDFKNAKDGDGIRYHGQEPKTLTAGGVDAKTLAFCLQTRDLYSYFAGNLDALGGLAPMAETLGQDRLLTEAAGAQLRDMQGKTIETMREIFRCLAYYEWHNTAKTRTLEKPIPGLPEMSIQTQWNRESRQGKFDEYDLDIDVYSLLDDSPSLKLQRLSVIMQQYVLPLLPEIQRQGGVMDVQAIISMVAKCADLRELEDIITFSDISPEQQQQQQGMPNETKRTYERVSRPGATPRGKSDAMQRVLLGENLQDSEAAVLG